MVNRDDPVDKVTKRLKRVGEKQFKNEKTLAELKKIEESFFELDKDSQRLFDRLHSVWRADQELGPIINHDQTEFQYRKRRVTQELEMKKKEFLKVKRELFDLEDELHRLKRTLGQEEEK